MSRILVVEDNAASARLVHDVLTYRGHVVIAAPNVDCARARLRESPPDLILTDLRLPDGGGDQVLAEIRANPAIAHLPVVVLTASAMDGDRERILALGFDGYLSKPLDLRTFERGVDAWLVMGAERTAAMKDR